MTRFGWLWAVACSDRRAPGPEPLDHRRGPAEALVFEVGSGFSEDGWPLDPTLEREWRDAGVVAVGPLHREAPRRNLTAFLALGLDRQHVALVEGDIEAARGLLAQTPGVAWGGADGRGYAAAPPSDAAFGLQWPLSSDGTIDGTLPGRDIGAVDAWNVTVGDSSIVIAVLDTGANLVEPDLVEALWVNKGEDPDNGIDDDGNGFVDDWAGWDFSGDDSEPLDENGHGSNVAGVAAATGDNGVGFAGVCQRCTVMPVQDLDRDGIGFLSDWAEAVVYAVDNGAHVVNMSQISPDLSPALEDAVAYALASGVPVVAATGNDDLEIALVPAAYDDVIGVGASDGLDRRVSMAIGGYWGSNWGDVVDVLAPGMTIYGLDDEVGAYDVARSGTSQSTPFVAGLYGLLLSLDPTLGPSELADYLAAGARDLVGDPDEDLVGKDAYQGWGVVDLARTVALWEAGPPPGMRLSCEEGTPGGQMECRVDGAQPSSFVRFRLGLAEGDGKCPADMGGLCWGIVGAGPRRDQLTDATGSATFGQLLSVSRDFGPMGALQVADPLGESSQVSNVVLPTVVGCGDGAIGGNEACDDANVDDFDGCVSDCTADPELRYSKVASGGHHGCGLLADGSLACFGEGDVGQTDAPPGTFVDVTSGRYHSCAIDLHAKLACWGLDDRGQASAPAGDFVEVDAGWYHTCAVDVGGALQCWGDDAAGESSPPPGWHRDVGTGFEFSCALDALDQPVCWGASESGQLDVPGGAFAALAVGGSHACVLDGAGQPTCWGWNAYGQTTAVPGTYVEIVAGLSHTCATNLFGDVTCWGRDLLAQTRPPQDALTGLSAGRYHTCGIDDHGVVACWGSNSSGQATPYCGDGLLHVHEGCDDGNLTEADGCDARCIPE